MLLRRALDRDRRVDFYEVVLRRLKPAGRLGFICADRWMRNQYGRQLRELVTRRYSMDLVLTMHDVDAFHDQVSAYPAITIISHAAQGPAIAADTTSKFGARQAREFTKWALTASQPLIQDSSYQAARLPHWFPGGDFWPAASAARLATITGGVLYPLAGLPGRQCSASSVHSFTLSLPPCGACGCPRSCEPGQ